ncbi:MAG: hypothetical protein IJ809_06885 [Clostridia bacterium]|nr:hypothetical protein [Clostridia bacterium]
MISKELILKGLNSDEDLLKKAMFKYVSKYSLYNTYEEVESVFKSYIEENIENTSDFVVLTFLKYSKLNEEIVNFFIEIYKKANDNKVKEKLEEVFFYHLNILKNLNYEPNEIFKDRDYSLIYKKYLHFINKDKRQLFEMYKDKLLVIDKLEIQN